MFNVRFLCSMQNRIPELLMFCYNLYEHVWNLISVIQIRRAACVRQRWLLSQSNVEHKFYNKNDEMFPISLYAILVLTAWINSYSAINSIKANLAICLLIQCFSKLVEISFIQTLPLRFSLVCCVTMLANVMSLFSISGLIKHVHLSCTNLRMTCVKLQNTIQRAKKLQSFAFSSTSYCLNTLAPICEQHDQWSDDGLLNLPLYSGVEGGAFCDMKCLLSMPGLDLVRLKPAQDVQSQFQSQVSLYFPTPLFFMR